jgi:hypothetical protein
MLTRCPACGAQASLDVLVAHEDARLLLAEVLTGGALPFGPLVLRYLSFFRPAKRELRMEKVARLLRALQAVVDAHDKGSLTLPLADHGYLYAILMAQADKAEGTQEREAEAARRSPVRVGNVATRGQAQTVADLAGKAIKSSPVSPEQKAELRRLSDRMKGVAQ